MNKDTNQYKNIKPLIIGIGVAGRRHLETQLNLGIRTGVYTTNPKTTNSLRKNKKIIVFDSLEEAIDWSNLVHVCTPDDKHTEFVAMALKKRKAVLCEKAFTTSLKDALYLQKLAHKYNTEVIVGQNYRLTPSFLETKKMILEGRLGTIRKIETTYIHDKNDYQKRYSDKNFLYIGGSHAVDLAYWIAGEKKVKVEATLKNLLNYHITLKFSSGVLGEVDLDATQPRSISGTDLIVWGEKGKLVSHNKVDKLLFHKNEKRKPQSIQLQNTKTYTIPLEIKIINDYISGKITSHWPLPNVDEAIDVIKILDAVLKI